MGRGGGYECSVNFPLTGIRGIACAGPAWGVSRLSLKSFGFRHVAAWLGPAEIVTCD